MGSFLREWYMSVNRYINVFCIRSIYFSHYDASSDFGQVTISGALMFSLICVWINDWVNNREAGDLRRHRAHYDVIVTVTLDGRANIMCRNGLNVPITFPNEKLTAASEAKAAIISDLDICICNYRKISNIRRTKSPNLNVSRLVLQLPLPNPVKSGVKSRMKM